MKSQWKKRNNKNSPPPIIKTGVDFSTDSMTKGSELKVAESDPKKPSDGTVIQMITQGSSPLMINTANRIPQRKNHRLAFWDIVPRTSALMTALSMLLTVSNKHRPMTIRIIEM